MLKRELALAIVFSIGSNGVQAQITQTAPAPQQQAAPAQQSAPVQNFYLMPNSSNTSYSTPSPPPQQQAAPPPSPPPVYGGGAGAGDNSNLAISGASSVQAVGGGAPTPPSAPVAPAGAVFTPAGPAVRTVGAAVVPSFPIVAPPPSIMPGPPGTHRLDSISGEYVYLDGGLRVRLAGVLFPQGVAGNSARTELKEFVRTMPLTVEVAKGSPPLGDQECTAWLALPDKRNVSLDLVARGVVAIDPKASFHSNAERAEFLASQQTARQRRLGLWARR